LLTLFNLAANPRRRFAWGWGLGQPLMDDRLSAREKLSVVLASWWGRVLLVLDLGWIALVGLAPN
jgi:hypothetical protein